MLILILFSLFFGVTQNARPKLIMAVKAIETVENDIFNRG
jgi:hypothetical protein